MHPGRLERDNVRVLVTGGFGYVGGRVAKFLAETGCQVVLASRKAQYSPEWLPQAEVVQLQWDDDEALLDACRGIKVIIHAAGMNAGDCAVDPVGALVFNGVATARLVTASLQAGVSKFIYFSTVHVYRSPLVGYFDENSCPRNTHPYASSHLAGEQAVDYARKNNDQFDGIILRLSNVIGAPVSLGVNCWMLLVNELCRELVKTRVMNIRGNIHEFRDFVPMSHVCFVCKSLIDSQERLNESINNVCSGASMTIGQIAELIGERFITLTGEKYKITTLHSGGNGVAKLQFASDEYCLKDSDKLLALYNSEIDELLQFCKRHWGE